MEFKKDKGLYVMPIIFIVLSLIMIGVSFFMGIDSVSKFFVRNILSFLILILSIIPLIINLCAKNIRFSIDNEHIYVGDLIIDLDAILELRASSSLLRPKTRPNIDILLKNGNRVLITRVSNSLEAIRIVNKDYLKLKGPGIR
jgi:hypothetical protein